MDTHLKQFVEERLTEEMKKVVPRVLKESTPRIFNLEQRDILQLLDDILSGQPVLNYTEKLAGRFFEAKVKDGKALGRYKDAAEAGVDFSFRDESGILTILTDSGLFENNISHFKFEILNPSSLSDYIDYALGDATLAVEFTGTMTSDLARQLNGMQDSVKFMSQSDITKKPKPLSPQLKAQIQNARDSVASSPKLSVDEKKKLESLVSASLIEIFGDSVLGGRMEGLFITGAGKPFKVPEAGFATIQRLQAPMYAVFSGRSGFSQYDVVERLQAAATDPTKAASDRMIADIRNYLKAASNGFGVSGFRTFFAPNEAKKLSAQLDAVLAGKEDPKGFVRDMARRIGSKRSWVKV